MTKSVLSWAPQAAGKRMAFARFVIVTDTRRELFDLAASISQLGSARLYRVNLIDLTTTAVRTSHGSAPSWSDAELVAKNAADQLIANHVELRIRHMLATFEIRYRSQVTVQFATAKNPRVAVEALA